MGKVHLDSLKKKRKERNKKQYAAEKYTSFQPKNPRRRLIKFMYRSLASSLEKDNDNARKDTMVELIRV